MKKMIIFATVLFLSIVTLTIPTKASETNNISKNAEYSDIVPYDGDVISKKVYNTETFNWNGTQYAITFIFTVSYNSRTAQIYSVSFDDWYSNLPNPYYSECRVLLPGSGTYERYYLIEVKVKNPLYTVTTLNINTRVAV